MLKWLKKRKERAGTLQPEGTLRAHGTRAGGPDGRLPAAIRAGYDAGHPIVDGPHYLDVLKALHAAFRPEWYLEIGTHRGASLSQCTGNFIAIDPAFRLKKYTYGPSVQGHFFQLTSDDFFASGFLDRTGIRPNLGFLDGLHLWEYLLRDFINFEKSAAPGAVAILHDCLPHSALMEARDWDKDKIRLWTGDVWKTVVALQDLRPDLKITVLDAYPTGLVVVEGIDPCNTALEAGYDDCVARLGHQTLRDFGVAQYFDRFDILSSHSFITDLAKRPNDTAKKGN